MNTEYNIKKRLIFNIAKLETENLFDDVVVIKSLDYSRIFNIYTITQLVNVDGSKMIMIVNLIRQFNRTHFNYVGLISEYDFK